MRERDKNKASANLESAEGPADTPFRFLFCGLKIARTGAERALVLCALLCVRTRAHAFRHAVQKPLSVLFFCLLA
jgi:hypothetical protein